VLGFSYGASAALRTSSARYRPATGTFQAVASFYPMCVSPRADWPGDAQERSNNLFSDVVVPTLVLMGAEDTNTPNVAINCERLVAQLKRAGRPITIHMYPGAGHEFDAGATRHPVAAGKATEDMFRFFAEHLKR
jgi:dienelactone hydrolase